MFVNIFIIHCKAHVRESLEPLLEGYQSGLETGDLESAAYCAHSYCFQSFLVGKELGEVEREMTIYSEAIRQLGQQQTLTWIQIYHQSVLNLMGYSTSPIHLIGEAYNQENRLSQHKTANDEIAIFSVYFNKFLLCYLFSDYSQAAENSAIVEVPTLG